MKSVFVVAAILFISSFSQAAENTWDHLYLWNGDTKINVDYQTPMALGNTVAGFSGYINVHHQGSCMGGVVATLKTSCSGSPANEQRLALYFGNADGACNYWTKVSAVRATHAGLCQQQLKIEIGNTPVLDPESGTEWFTFTVPTIR